MLRIIVRLATNFNNQQLPQKKSTHIQTSFITCAAWMKTNVKKTLVDFCTLIIGENLDTIIYFDNIRDNDLSNF